MPFTPYHFGPSGFVGLLFRRWLDVPVFIAANILIDIEVLVDQQFAPGWPVHQLWHFHTLLIGGLAGAIFGLVAYYIKPVRWLCEKSMSLIGLPSKATLLSMVLAGLLGAWLHVIIDSFYHYDIQIFWPYRDNTIFRWINSGKMSNMAATQRQVMFWCRIFWGLMLALYAVLLVFASKKTRKRS
ncbi:MAG: hydrolase [Planctomycetes bacterium]|nr:hydrolase [Planctomycetota bacterium]